MNKLKKRFQIFIALGVAFLFGSYLPSVSSQQGELRWVLTDTQIKPDGNFLRKTGGGATPGYLTGPRYKGSSDEFTVTETSFIHHHIRIDGGKKLRDLILTAEFSKPDTVLIPGEMVTLYAKIAMAGEANHGSEGMEIKFEKMGIFLRGTHKADTGTHSDPPFRTERISVSFRVPEVVKNRQIGIQVSSDPVFSVRWMYRPDYDPETAHLIDPCFRGKGVFKENELVLPPILLPEGKRIPLYLNDPDLWRDWIEHRRGKPLETGFQKVAHLFKEEGEKLGIFWPAVLVQSCHETNFYFYGGRAKKENWNVGGVGITQRDETTKRQNFECLRRGIRAMLEHVAIYADPNKMEKKIKELNSKRKSEFTADRTKEQLETIRGKYNTFREQTKDDPCRMVKFKDLGSFSEDFTKEEGYADYGAIRDLIGGATLTYAGDPFYGARVYTKWEEALEFLKDRYTKR